MPAKFTVYTDKAKKYRFNLKASNGEIIASSEAYNTKAAALGGIKSIQKNAAAAKIEDLEAVEKKTPVKKTAAKKTSEKTPAVKKPAAKKPAVKKAPKT